MKKEVPNPEDAFEELTPEDLEQKYGLKEEDLKFYTNATKMLPEDDSVGIHKYNSLIEKRSANNNWNFLNPYKTPKDLSDLEKAQIISYETEKVIRQRQQKEKEAEYIQNVRSNKRSAIETTKGVPVDKKTLYIAFKEVFRFLTGKDFVEDSDTLLNIEAIVKYFAKDESFFDCKRLVVNVDGVVLNPSFDKGFLIIGNFGNGKSTIMKCFEYLINHNYSIAMEQHWDTFVQWQDIRFKIANCHDLVTEFEALSSPHEKQVFFEKYSNFRYSFDDIKKEKIASNYGLTNVMQAIYEKRYDRMIRNQSIPRLLSIKTFGTMNYDDNHPNDLSKALDEIGTKYGNHVYDRVFEMYNIIEFKGKSFRV